MFQKLRGLSQDPAVYGVGGVAVSVAGFRLVPIDVRFLTPGGRLVDRVARVADPAATLPAPEDRSQR